MRRRPVAPAMPDDAPDAAEYPTAVELLGVTRKTRPMIASEAITAGQAVFTAASGKVQDLPVASGTYYQVGTALTAAAADAMVRSVAGVARPEVLDAGCGEGYYLRQLVAAAEARALPLALLGLDISKWAVQAAAKRERPMVRSWKG